jgi:hypothetical protein
MLRYLLHAPRGPFYSPKAARSRWRQTWKAILAFCQVAHRTVRCATEQLLYLSGARFPSKSGTDDRCSSGPVGAPDSPVPPHRPLELPRVARRFRGRPLALATVGSPDSPVNYSRTPPTNPESGEFAANQPGAPDIVRCTTRQSGVPDQAEVWLLTAKSFAIRFLSFRHCF